MDTMNAIQLVRKRLTDALAKPLPPPRDHIGGGDAYFDPWEDVVQNIYGFYSSQSDQLMIKTLEAVRDGTTFELIEAEGFVVEFMLYVLAGHGLTEYGSSPRGAWPEYRDLWQPLIDKWKAYYEIAWNDDSE